MKTNPWRCAQVYQNFALLQKIVLLVQLDEFEGSTGSVALFLCEAIPFVETTFAVLEIYLSCVCSDLRLILLPFFEHPLCND